jgi:hypothetical protein
MALLGAHGATFGLTPKIVRGINALNPFSDVSGEDIERAAMGGIESARENTGAAGTAAEIAGGMLVPLPGGSALGVTKALGSTAMRTAGKAAIAKAVAPKLLEAGAKGALVGGLGGAAQTYGETQTEDVTPEQVLEGGLQGAKWGAGLGAAGHGVGEALAKRASTLRYAAAGADAGQIRKAAKKSLSYSHGLDKDAEALARAQDEGLIGNVLQASPGTVSRSQRVLEEVGGRLEGMYTDMDKVLAKNKAALSTTGFHNAGMDAVAQRFGGVKNAQGVYEFPNLGGTQLEGLQSALGDVVQFKPGQKVSASEMWKKTRNLNESVHGIRGDDPVNSFRKKVLSTYREGIKDMTNLTAERMSGSPQSGLPSDFAANFKKSNQQYHDAKLVEGFGLQGMTSDEGKSYLGLGVRGILGAGTVGGANWLLGKVAPDWAQDPVMSTAVGLGAGVLGGRRGRMANTELALGRAAERYFPATARAGGVIGARAGAQPGTPMTEDEVLNRFFEKERRERNKINYTPRSPLNSQ